MSYLTIILFWLYGVFMSIAFTRKDSSIAIVNFFFGIICFAGGIILMTK